MRLAGDQARCAWHVLLAYLAACLGGCAAKPPHLTTNDVEAVEIRLEAWGDHQKAAGLKSTDAAKIEALLALFRSAEATGDHKCGDSGRIVLHLKDGGEARVGILAGHNSRYYEFRVYRGRSYNIFRTERFPFLKAMAAFGLGELDLGAPE